MADRLIYADKLKAHYAWWKGGTREMTMDEAKSDFDCIIDLQPTVEAEPTKHGRWISIYGWVHCSVCHQEPPSESNIESDYCPNCGARMDEPAPEAAEIINDGTYSAGEEEE